MPIVEAGALRVAFEEKGPADGPVALLLHGFPYDVRAYDACASLLAARGVRAIVPWLRGFGTTRFREPASLRTGQQAALATDLVALMAALDVPRAILAGYDWGGRAACITAALWPERCSGLVSGGTGYNIQDIAAAGEPADPAEDHRFWYQYYFHTARGRNALIRRRRELCRYIWQLWSPTWRFDEAVFERTAVAFDNEDFVDIVVHSYRHRHGIVEGDPALDAIEARLARRPPIAVPTLVLQGLDDGVDPPGEDDRDHRHFTGAYERRLIEGAGHNLPQEAPEAFAQAVLDLLGDAA